MNIRCTLMCACLTAGASIAAPALQAQQRPLGQPPPDSDYIQPDPEPAVPIPATAFVMPDLPDRAYERTTYDGRLFSTRFSLVGLVDYNAFVQDDDNRRQVGEQENQWDLRTMRLMFRGRLKFAHPVDYFVSFEVKAQDHADDDGGRLGFTDAELSTSVGALGTLRYGKIKEPFVYEMVGDAANLQQQERALSPFFASRGIGLRLSRPFAGNSMTYSVGWFNDWWTKDQRFKESGNNLAGRLTAVPYWKRDGADYVHVGISGRRIGDDEGTVQFRGRPESNVTSYYVDSGPIAADHANELNVEGLWSSGPLLVSSDLARAWVDAADSGNPRFWGVSIAVSYTLTGEHRPYDRTVGYARRIQPRDRWGAWEIAARYSHVDIADRLVDGGVFDRETLGLNWWATRRWKVGFDYGLIHLDRGGVTGTTSAFHTRLQWIY